MAATAWYHNRLHMQQSLDAALWMRHRDAIESFAAGGLPAAHIDLQARFAVALKHLRYVKSDAYPRELVGTIGADPSIIWKIA